MNKNRAVRANGFRPNLKPCCEGPCCMSLTAAVHAIKFIILLFCNGSKFTDSKQIHKSILKLKALKVLHACEFLLTTEMCN